MTSRLPIAALILVQLIFGFNYAASKVILEQYPPLLWGGIRMIIAAILMFACAFMVVPKSQRRIDREFLFRTFLYAFFGIALCQGFFLLGLRYTTTTNCAILNTLTPIFTLMFAVLFKREKWTVLRGLGFFIAVLGVLVLRRVEDFSLASGTFKGDIFTMLSCTSLALFFILSRDFLKKNSPFWATAWMFFFGAILLMIAGASDYAHVVPEHLDSRMWIAMTYSVVAATMITYFLNSWTLTKVNSSSVALFIYLQPGIAVLNAWFSKDEVPSGRTLLAMICIFTGVSLGVIKRG